MKIAYVCTNYNNSRFTVAAAKSLLRNAPHDIRIYVVDNASRPDEVEILTQLASSTPTVHLILNQDNLGYFAGLNKGIEAARRSDPDLKWIVAGNNDLEFPDNFCDQISSNQDQLCKYLVVSPDVVTLDGQHQNPHVIERISTLREIFYELYYSNYYLGALIYKTAKLFPKATRRGDEDEWRTPRLIHQGHGSCYLLTPRFFDLFQEFWAPTFMMAEELFLSIQLRNVGEQVFYSPSIQVIHHWHGSLQDLPSRRRWNMARDAHRVYRKHVKIFKFFGN